MNMATKNKSYARTTHGLRDMLFDEIERMQTEVANLSKQIIGTAKVELDFHRTISALAEKGTPVSLGTLALGSN
jgi:hypothetical protein